MLYHVYARAAVEAGTEAKAREIAEMEDVVWATCNVPGMRGRLAVPAAVIGAMTTINAGLALAVSMAN